MNGCSSPLLPVRTTAPLFYQLPVEVRQMVVEQLSLADLVAIGQTNRASRVWAQRRELLEPRILGERGAMGRYVAARSEEGPWARATRQNLWFSHLKKSGHALPSLREGAGNTLSQSGRFVVSRLPSNDIVAYDILSPHSPCRVVARHAGYAKLLEFWDEEGLLWALSGASAKLWKVGAPDQTVACFSIGCEEGRIATGDSGRLLMVIRTRLFELTWFRVSDLLRGLTKPAERQTSVICATIAPQTGHIAILQRDDAPFDKASFCLDRQANQDNGLAQRVRPTPREMQKATLVVRDLHQDTLLLNERISWPPSGGRSFEHARLWLSGNGRRVAFSPHSEILATLAVGETADPRPQLIKGLCGCGINELLLSPNGAFLSYIGGEDDAQLFDLRHGGSSPLHEEGAGSLFSVHRFSADGTVWWLDEKVIELDSEVTDVMSEQVAGIDHLEGTTDLQSARPVSVSAGKRSPHTGDKFKQRPEEWALLSNSRGLCLVALRTHASFGSEG